MPRHTPITDFLFRLEVDPDFVKRVLDDAQREPLDPERDAALREFGGLDDDTRAAIMDAIASADFSSLQSAVLAEHPDTETVRILPKGWVA